MVNDTQILFGIIIFLSVFAFTQASFNTEIITAREGWNASYVEGNESVLSPSIEVLPAPPVCTRFIGGYVPILGDLIDGVACMGGYVVWLLSLMFIQSEIAWLYQLIIFPMICIIGIIIIRLIRSGGG